MSIRKWAPALAILMTVSAPSLYAADYTIDPAHSSVGFKIRHLVGTVKGRFTDFSGTVSYDPAKPEQAKVEALIQTKSIDTDNEKRDTHLRSPDFFNVEKSPSMTFKSQSVKKSGDKLLVAGQLTLLGVTKPVTLDVTGGDTLKDPWGNTRTGFSATGTINRKDYGMVWNKALDAGGWMIGDDVTIEIEIEAVQNK